MRNLPLISHIQKWPIILRFFPGLCLSLMCCFALLFFTFLTSQTVLAAGSCAKNYKNALHVSYKKYAEPLKYAVRISHSKSDIFSGKWEVRPDKALPRSRARRKKRSRKWRRARNKDALILASLKNPHFSPLKYTNQERQILKIADSVVRGRGKDPAFNKRGRYGWLTTRIAADLRVYMGQSHHPALCTGANLMMDHLYDNSGRFRKRIALINQLAPLSHQYAAARFRAFKHAMETEQNPEFVKLGRLDKHASLSDLMMKVAKFFNNRAFTRKVDQEPQFLPTLQLIRNYANLSSDADNRYSRRGGKKGGRLAIISLPMKRPSLRALNVQTVSFSPGRSLQKSRFITSSIGSSRLTRSKKVTLSSRQLKALRKSLSAIEAAFYIDHIAQAYQALNGSIFGAISAVRQSHKTHCICSS